MLKAFFLYPLSLIYAFVVGLRNFLFDYNILKSEEFDIPVISVGNITVGGTGKTPHVEYLVSLLKEKYNVAVLSRGYKRKTKGFILADNNSGYNELGDELMQIKQKFPDIIVAASEKRVIGIKKLMSLENKPDLIILDDAFQHRFVKPGMSVLLIDYNRSVFSDKYLPYGYLRDNPSQRHRANIIIVTKAPENIKPIDMRIMAKQIKLFPYQSMYFSSIIYKKLLPIYFGKHYFLDLDIIKNENYTILLITGIAFSGQIFDFVSKLSDTVKHVKFSDHHDYTQSDAENILNEFLKIQNNKKVIITTEKDAVKLRNIDITNVNLRERMYYLPIEISILNNEKTDFDSQIINYIDKDKTNYRFLTTKRQY